jgi:GntR family transcriptional regulator, vanillate catabolism transcriptional regulator
MTDDPRPPQLLRAVMQLRAKLLAGEFPPGERVAELALAPMLGVSRTPLRLALTQLEHEGLLRTLPGGGFVVRDFTISDIRDAIELRGILEGSAARFAAERWTNPRSLNPLARSVAAMDALFEAASFDFAAYVAENERFHTALLDLAQSAMLARALAQATALPFASASAFVMAQSEIDKRNRILLIAQDQHRLILEAVQNREGGRAEALAREHARLAIRNLEASLRNQAAFDAVPGSALIRTDSEEDDHAIRA